ncbi:MAG: prenyltransferase [Betaproteobacteria bacterium]|nr:prenyltransferase [Gammaproteobacteria bacterium]MDH3435960.1 prenyltransferase [Betaproteobacteria bacterium]
MSPVEPTVAALSNPALRYVLATRPPFLSVTLFACLIGLGSAFFGGVVLSAAKALATLVFALIAHAGINVLNDYYDELNGTDRANTERVFPFTGGSRFIQNEVFTARETRAFGAALLGVVVVAGIWLASVSAPGLIGIGAAGLFIGWAYSAPPFALNSRGLGELCVALGFGLIVVGTDFVQRGSLSILPATAAVPYALLVTNVLYINQFPDRRADEFAGKRHWVVRLSAERARWGYLAIGIAAYGFLLAAAVAGYLPRLCLVALLTAALTLKAGVDLLKFSAQPQRLVAAIKLTIGAAALHGLLLASALFLSGR